MFSIAKLITSSFKIYFVKHKKKNLNYIKFFKLLLKTNVRTQEIQLFSLVCSKTRVTQYVINDHFLLHFAEGIGPALVFYSPGVQRG